MPSRWWYVVALGPLTWGGLFLVVGIPTGTVPNTVSDVVAVAALLAWPAIPVGLYLDRRAIADETGWDPRTRLWLLAGMVPFVVASVGAAYCLRRVSALRGTVPSGGWYHATAVGAVGWTVTVAVDLAVDHVALGIVEDVVFGPPLWLLWFGFPVALYLDSVRAQAYLPEFDPRQEALSALSVVPLVNLIVGWSYLAGRWWAGHSGEVRAEPDVDGVDRAGDGRERISPWYRRAAVVYGLYVAGIAALGAVLGLEADLSWNVLALLVWPPFGLGFVACFHYDQRALDDAGLAWGRTRLVYYLGVVVPALGFWYLLSRFSTVRRARRRGLLDVGDDGPGGSDVGAAPSGGNDDDTAGSDGDDAVGDVDGDDDEVGRSAWNTDG